jgi:hypothetical protein
MKLFVICDCATGGVCTGKTTDIVPQHETAVQKNVLKPTRKMDRQTSHQKMKPYCIAGYSKIMGAVDRSDTMISSVE